MKDLSTKPDKSKRLIISMAVVMIIISPISIFIFGVNNWKFFVPSILIVVVFSVMAIIYATMSGERIATYTKLTKEQKRKEKLIYTVCLGLFMILGVLFDIFHIAWIIFIFGFAATLLIKK